MVGVWRGSHIEYNIGDKDACATRGAGGDIRPSGRTMRSHGRLSMPEPRSLRFLHTRCSMQSP